MIEGEPMGDKGEAEGGEREKKRGKGREQSQGFTTGGSVR